MLSAASQIARIAWQKRAEVIIGWIATGQLYGGLPRRSPATRALVPTFHPDEQGTIDVSRPGCRERRHRLPRSGCGGAENLRRAALPPSSIPASNWTASISKP